MLKKKLAAGITAVLLASAMLLNTTSCGLIIINDVSQRQENESDSEGSETEQKPSHTQKDYIKYENPLDGKALSMQYLEALPARDYEGAVFIITTPSADYIAPQDTELAMSRLAVERNRQVEELYNLTLITSVTKTDTMLTELKQNVAADSYYSDLLMMPIYTVGQFRKDDTLINLRSIPFFDITKPYFNTESSDMTSGGYMTYGVAGEASISPDSFSAVYMNKELLLTAGIDPAYLYDLAEEGSWTWDNLLRCTAAVTELNTSGEAGREYYTVTAESTASRLPDLIFKSAGHDFIRTGRRSIPVVAFRANTAKTVLDQIAAIYNDPKAITDSTAGAVSCFSKGESAFLIEYLSVMPSISSAASDWGVLPLPKGDEKDDYRTLIANTELVFGVPVNHTNGEYAGIILSALNAASCGYIYDAYVEYNMLHVLRDNESVNLLDMLLDTASFDFALAFGNAYPEIANVTYKLVRSTAKSNDLEDKFAKLLDAANAVLQKEFDLRP
ncbi:MAG: extracellular solute-binding protein [Clostridia bacterium]|nr:extracellular solute-binding protein [Clostridia bacterium]